MMWRLLSLQDRLVKGAGMRREIPDVVMYISHCIARVIVDFQLMMFFHSILSYKEHECSHRSPRSKRLFERSFLDP